MNRSQATRIALLLIAIFSAGILTGRLTAPLPVAIKTADGRQVTAAGMLELLTKELQLDASQSAQIKPLLEAATDQMSQLPVGSPERIEPFRQSVGKVRALLHPEQRNRFDQLVQETVRRYRERNAKSITNDPKP